MIKKISACVNVALVDYDASMMDHVIELMKESLREQYFETIYEDTWIVEENKRKLFKNEEGVWVPQPINSMLFEGVDKGEMLEVMTVGITVDVESAT